MKVCGKCGESKPLEDFHRRPDAPDGRRGNCKACDRARSADWARRNPKRVAEIKKRERRRNPKREAASTARFRRLYPEKNRARAVINMAVRRGTVEKPKHCSDCGLSTPSRSLHAHHTDYSRPLDVTWLCSDCHTAIHHGSSRAT